MASFNREFIKRVTPVLESAGFHRNTKHAMRFERSVRGHLHLADADLSTRVQEVRLYLAIDHEPFGANRIGVLAELAIPSETPQERMAAVELMAATLPDAGMRFFHNPYSRTRAEWWDQAGFHLYDYNLVACTLRRLPKWNKTRATLRLKQNAIQLGIDFFEAIDTLILNDTVPTKAISRFDAFELHDRIKDSGLVLEAPAWNK